MDTGAADPSAASREEAVWEEEGLLSVAGGKLTTWRAMSEEVVDLALKRLPPERARRAAPCATAGIAVGAPAPADLPRQLAATHRAEPSIADALARRLGAVAWTACREAAPADLHPLLEGTDLCAAEVRAHLRYGAVVRLADLLLRRARFGLWDPEAARALVPLLGPVVRDEMGWDGVRWEREVEETAAALESWRPAT